MEYHAFTRMSATDMCIIVLNDAIITEHNNEITAYKNGIVDLFYTVIKISGYVPWDLNEIVKTSNDLIKCEKIFLKTFIKDFEANRKICLKVLREVASKNLK